MRLIDADAYVVYLSDVMKNIEEDPDRTINGIIMAAIISKSIQSDMRDEAITPTIDAVPVVRCKDCRWWDVDWIPESYPRGHYCAPTDMLTDGEFYCAYAERKGDNNDGNKTL